MAMNRKPKFLRSSIGIIITCAAALCFTGSAKSDTLPPVPPGSDALSVFDGTGTILGAVGRVTVSISEANQTNLGETISIPTQVNFYRPFAVEFTDPGSPPGSLQISDIVYFDGQNFVLLSDSQEGGSLVLPPNLTITDIVLETGVWVNVAFPLGFGGNTSLIQVDVVSDVETPLPAALPLFAAGLGTIGLLGWRRKRKTQAVAAA
jgi:hypothetical protein